MEEQVKLIIDKWSLGMVHDDCAKELTSMVMEFIEWLEFGDHKFYPNAEKNKTGYYTEGSHRIYTTNELFEYWINNIRKP